MTLTLFLKARAFPIPFEPGKARGGKRYKKIVKRCRRWVVSKFPGLQCKEELEDFKRIEARALEEQAKVMRVRWEDEDLALVAAIIEEEEGI